MALSTWVPAIPVCKTQTGFDGTAPRCDRAWESIFVCPGGRAGQRTGLGTVEPKAPFTSALQRLRGTRDVARELAELQRERAACGNDGPRRAWQLFSDRALRRQVMSLVVLGSAMELCGNDSVRCRARAAGAGRARGARLSPCPLAAGVRLCVLGVPRRGNARRQDCLCPGGHRRLRAAGFSPERESPTRTLRPSPFHPS